MSFATKTSVSVEKTRVEIERLLVAHKAYQYAVMMDEPAGMAFVAFTMGTDKALRQVRIGLPLPKLNDFQGGGYRSRSRSPAQQRKHHEQACRSRWRMLLLVLKANLEAVDAGVTTFEKAFFAHIRLPNGDVVHDVVAPKLAEAYQSGTIPPLLGGPGSHERSSP